MGGVCDTTEVEPCYKALEITGPMRFFRGLPGNSDEARNRETQKGRDPSRTLPEASSSKCYFVTV